MAHHHQRDLINKDDAAERLKIPVHAPSAAVGSLPSPLSLPPPAVTPGACSPPHASSSSAVVSPRSTDTVPAVLQLSGPAAADPAPSPSPAASFSAGVPVRCTSCRKRVGLAGFRCRCGDLFCGVHRYSDRHACTFDYKAQAREAIARDNPVHKAAKLLKI